MIDPNGEVSKAQTLQHLRRGRADVRLGEQALGSDDVHVTLEEFTKAPTRRAVRTPHRLNLIPLKKARQGADLRHHTDQRYGQVITQAQVTEVFFPDRWLGQRAGQGVAAMEQAKQELIALTAVLAEQHGQVFQGGRLEGNEPVALVDLLDNPRHVPPARDILGQKISRATGRLGTDLGGLAHRRLSARR